MNVLLKVQRASDAAKIAHSVMAYDLATEELDLELPIPLFLDTLALKMARVPPEDESGALVPLEARRLIPSGSARPGWTCRSESTSRIDGWPRDQLWATEAGGRGMVTQVTPHPRYARTEKPRIAERELVVPTLRLLDDGNRGWMATSDIIARLTELFTPSGQDAAMLEGRSDTYFSLTVRNMISHRDQPSSFIHGVGALRAAWPANFR